MHPHSAQLHGPQSWGRTQPETCLPAWACEDGEEDLKGERDGTALCLRRRQPRVPQPPGLECAHCEPRAG